MSMETELIVIVCTAVGSILGALLTYLIKLVQRVLERAAQEGLLSDLTGSLYLHLRAWVEDNFDKALDILFEGKTEGAPERTGEQMPPKKGE